MRGRSISESSTGHGQHIITKQEAVDLIQSQFPDSMVSEPMAIENLRLGDDPHSHSFILWYFTVSETERSAAGEGGEYILDPYIPGGLSNRAALNRGSFHLDGYRMAKLDTPLRIFSKLKAARAAGGTFTPSDLPCGISRLYSGIA